MSTQDEHGSGTRPSTHERLFQWLMGLCVNAAQQRPDVAHCPAGYRVSCPRDVYVEDSDLSISGDAGRARCGQTTSMRRGDRGVWLVIAVIAIAGVTLWLVYAVWRSPRRDDLATFGSYVAGIAVVAEP